MSDLPELKADEIQLNNKESIAILADDIATLRKRGYEFQQIVDFLRENDFEITASTLKTYLREPKLDREKLPKKNTKKIKKSITQNQKDLGCTLQNAEKQQATKIVKDQAEFLIAPDRDVL
ncbi:hypothetical protein [Acetobacter persici]|uniref:hypothetical protein n=1 Tax=Acetobacter persici TaxID=1076596 RepID=UPI001F3C5397|nr:hypothetical protein [Acetobacter persici]MCG0998770.1 hypothetical protein [Acetobacter persici]